MEGKVGEIRGSDVDDVEWSRGHDLYGAEYSTYETVFITFEDMKKFNFIICGRDNRVY